MTLIHQTKHFIVEAHDAPFVSRTDGGHIRIRVKDESITDRTKLEPRSAIELMRLTMIVGEAFEKAMNRRGIPVVKINYQDMGNWAYKRGEKPFLHIHIFGRAKNAVHQIFPESVYLPARESGFYNSFEPLNEGDIEEIQKEMGRIEKEEKYQDNVWKM